MSAAPTPYDPSYNFTLFQQNNPNTPLPAVKVDNELDNIATSIDETQTRLAEIQKSDGTLGDVIVTVSTLAPDTVALIGAQFPTSNEFGQASTQVQLAEAQAEAAAASAVIAATDQEAAAASAAQAAASAATAASYPIPPWATGNLYQVNMEVVYQQEIYQCATAHYANVFATDLAAGKWLVIGGSTPTAGSVTNAALASAPAFTMKGNPTADIAPILDLTVAQVKALLAIGFSDISGLSAVAATGQYADVIGAPVVSAVGRSGNYADLLNQPDFATVAFTGLASDLVGGGLGNLQIKTFTVNGSWTVPPGVTTALVRAVGGGAGGGGGRGGATSAIGGGGGGGGAPGSCFITGLIPGSIIPYVVGVAGVGGAADTVGGTGATGGSGGQTSFGSYLISPGGFGGTGVLFSGGTGGGTNSPGGPAGSPGPNYESKRNTWTAGSNGTTTEIGIGATNSFINVAGAGGNGGSGSPTASAYTPSTSGQPGMIVIEYIG